jgi:diaminohydroxyphosphoribosylaminopyrimidine deaminase/5-amino-6-(5-phosphoribosylamino)uracil reductase
MDATSEQYMLRCFDLARLGSGRVSPNPLVGAVLVHRGRIIGEGFHERYGQAHAEVNALASVRPEDRHLVPESELHVSLEPCCIFGNTPPCTDLILKNRITRVAIATVDNSPGVNGRGIEILENSKVEVAQNVAAVAGKELNIIRHTFITRHRPYVVLKFAKSAAGFMGEEGKQVWLTNPYSQRLVHKWRSEVDAILVGYRTALWDNPQLSNRLFFGKSPARIILDRDASLPANLRVFDGSVRTIRVSENHSTQSLPVEQLTLPFDKQLLPKLLRMLADQSVTSVMVEGGARTLSGFLNTNLWDEARVFTTASSLNSGIAEPALHQCPASSFRLAGDLLEIYHNPAALR